MKSRLLLDTVAEKSAIIFKLSAIIDQPLLVWWNAFLVLNLSLNDLYGVTRPNFKGGRFPYESLHKDLHSTTKMQHKIDGGFLLNVVVRKTSALMKCLAGKHQQLFIRWNTFFFLNLGLDISDSITLIDIKSNGLSGEKLHKNLHPTTKRCRKVEGGSVPDEVV